LIMENTEMIVQNHELAASASAAQARAEIECAYTMAIRRPRNIADVRTKILAACQRPVFAESAEYSKPVGGKQIKGPSIRFVETALQAMKNTRVSTTVAYEDERVRKIHVSVVDLEENTAYGLDATVQKTVERKKIKEGQKILGERLNSYGEKTYLVEATEDDMTTKQNAIVSKMIRGCGLRLIPQDIVEEAMRTARATVANADKGDPKAATNRIIDAFAGLGVKPSELEQYLGKPLAQIVAKELADLKTIYTAIKEGESKWSDYLEEAQPAAPETIAEKLAKKTQTAPVAADPFAGLEKKYLDKAKKQTGLDSRKLSDDEVAKILAVYEEIKEGDI